MRSVWQSLVWKEWHEHKWKLAALTGVLCGVTGIALLDVIFVEDNWRGALESFLAGLVMGMIPLTMFIAAGDAAGENAGQTMPFLKALPIPMWKAAVWKISFTSITCLLPVALTLALISGIYYLTQGRGGEFDALIFLGQAKILKATRIENLLLAWNLVTAALVGTTTLSMLIWTMALGANRKSEIGAGATALLGIVGCWVAMFVLVSQFDPAFSPDSSRKLVHLVVAASPCGLPLLMAEGFKQWESVLLWAAPVAVATHVGLVVWYLQRFGRGPDVSAFSPAPAAARSAQLEWLGMPRRSPLSAIVWKQFCESGPIVLAGVAVILFFLVVNLVTNSAYYSHGYRIAGLLTELTTTLGFLTALILGIGVFDRDLSPKLHTFWRSRPIDPDLWYWVKYLTGLTVLAGALLSILALTFLIVRFSDPYRSMPVGLPDAVMMASIFISVYALALATICLVRMTVYAAILSAGCFAIGTSLIWFFLGDWLGNWVQSNWPTVITTMSLITALAATLVGWWAVRRDIGWKK